ncbi:hemerythrin domain-containing protein [Roseateles oligotrophus]|uniref:Hemerythrin n=1 Tax=Roseateles oligotrophus TaxID=1769250 RepID=A0ABT2YHF1_9BURK|nr:hemerythrin domain-containing protein [Roseateles oligotrophus]MCV2369421.1 hemerythrin [Roseateles oligotrophus]
MSILTWTDALALQQPQIDQTHQEFVVLLNELALALQTEDSALPVYQRLLAHTEQHFAMEEGFMAATGFAPDNCHSKQHAMVLDVMRQVLVHTHAEHDLEPMRNLLPELVNWFPSHAEMMDAALVFHMSQVGFDPATGAFSKPAMVGAEPISSCGSGSCG